MYKIIPYFVLKNNGYHTINIGSKIPSYCDSCKQQSIHRCIGSKLDGNETLYRFECTACKEKLDVKKK
jgi:hypothetical protein